MERTKLESDVGRFSRCTVVMTMISSVGSSPLWNRGTLINIEYKSGTSHLACHDLVQCHYIDSCPFDSMAMNVTVQVSQMLHCTIMRWPKILLLYIAYRHTACTRVHKCLMTLPLACDLEAELENG